VEVRERIQIEKNAALVGSESEELFVYASPWLHNMVLNKT
jgi:hypothetical protein